MEALVPPTDDDLSALLMAFLQADEHARNELPARVDQPLRRRASRLMPPNFDGRQLVDDVISRTWELLLRKPAGSFDPSRGTPLVYLSTVLRTAMRDVRDENAQVVTRARDYSSDGVDTGNLAAIDPHAASREFDLVDQGVDLAAALVAAPPSVREAVTLIAFGDITMISAATTVGMSRFSLKRRLHRWAAEADLAMVS